MNGLALATWRLPHVPLADLEAAREALDEHPPASTVFTLATCQRVLLAAQAAPEDDPGALATALAETLGVPGAERRTGLDALAHLARVASSLDAIVPGEDQAPAQVRQAIREQREDLESEMAGTLDRVLAIAKRARDAAGLTGERVTSLADAALPMIPDDHAVTLVGTGDIATAVANTLPADRLAHVVSRQPDRAAALAPDPDRVLTRERLLDDPPPIEALVLASNARRGPVIDADRLEPLTRHRDADGPLWIVDLGVPRNADPRLATRPEVEIRTLEDLARADRGRLLDDPRIATARQALADALDRERRRLQRRHLDDRIVALREALEDTLATLADDLDDEAPLDEATLDRFVHRAHGRLAHVAQTHLEAAVRGDRP